MTNKFSETEVGKELIEPYVRMRISLINAIDRAYVLGEKKGRRLEREDKFSNRPLFTPRQLEESKQKARLEMLAKVEEISKRDEDQNLVVDGYSFDKLKKEVEER